MAPKKGGGGGGVDEKAREPLVAVILADTYTQVRFLPFIFSIYGSVGSAEPLDGEQCVERGRARSAGNKKAGPTAE